MPLLKAVFAWARGVDPTQPLTAGVFSAVDPKHPRFSKCEQLREFQLKNSDVISFHRYADPEGDGPTVPSEIDELKKIGRPLLCTEYMARTVNSRFENHLALFNERGVGCFNWGLVAGKTQTFVPWGDKPRSEWHHDILHTWGTPYCQAEDAIIKCLTGKEPSGAGIQHSAIYRFKCLGHVEGNRWLDGRTATGELGLVPEQNLDQYSGTLWRAIEVMEGVFAFRCLGEIEGDRWLNGRTHDGSVGLAPDSSHFYSGTRWQLCRVREGVYVFRCLGEGEGYHRLLDGNTLAKTVGLAKHTEPRMTGLQWQAVKISDG